MRATLDCIPCFVRQTLDAARAASDDQSVHECMMREMLLWMGRADLAESPPAFAQHVHRYLRTLTSDGDPYRAAKDRQNQMALRLLPELRTLVRNAPDPLDTAVRLAIAGNVIDMGIAGDVDESDLRQTIDQALSQPLAGDHLDFYQAARTAGTVLYLADNAGEIAFDRLLIEQFQQSRVTVAVRGTPVINDATLIDAQAVRLEQIAEVISNGSDAPGTLLADCNKDFRRRFWESDLVIAKGQGNFESLSDVPRVIWFLFKVKCRVVANHVDVPMGTHLLKRSLWSSTTPRRGK